MGDDNTTAILESLRQKYRHIVLDYFHRNTDRAVKEFAEEAFAHHLAVSDIIKIHAELMEDLARQLKIEGRNPDILLDYRLTLIDVIAHLCERYRRCLRDT
ncbi:MAG: hypothetical protein RMK91_10315 [Pseudanabaenaceae cyanobacterium SKYGB_i_bin29]|nr:circadian clock protein KaiA [Pseudanabaenaceae cyanobacterium SKYG29]MDW8422245.1 hypothetical protein [Pseudanabaenaceae cyanobacterium SKYGB_i_bin29]